jgi:hypothetical protein
MLAEITPAMLVIPPQKMKDELPRARLRNLTHCIHGLRPGATPSAAGYGISGHPGCVAPIPTKITLPEWPMVA